MVRVNVNCVVDAKKTYLQSFVPKVSPAIVRIFRDLLQDAKALSGYKGKTKDDLARERRYIGNLEAAVVDLLQEVPDWPPTLVQEVVNKLRAECPPYMKLFEKIFLATGVILNTLHSKESAHRPSVVLPEETDVAHGIVKAVAAALETDPSVLTDPRRARDLLEVIDTSIKAAVLRMIPVEDIAESGDDDEEEAKVEARQPVGPDAQLSAIANQPEVPPEVPRGRSRSPERRSKSRSRSRSRSGSRSGSRRRSKSRSKSPEQVRNVQIGDRSSAPAPASENPVRTIPADDGW